MYVKSEAARNSEVAIYDDKSQYERMGKIMEILVNKTSHESKFVLDGSL